MLLKIVYIHDTDPLQFILALNSKVSFSEWEILPHEKSEQLSQSQVSS
jgi:hypothetical protein